MKVNSFIVFLMTSLTLYAQESRSPHIPDGYELSFYDECDDLYLDTEGDGSDYWATWWVGWNVRHLSGNKDKAWKCDESYTGSGTEPLNVVLHEATDEGTLRLLGKVTPEDKLDIVNNMPYVGGMISNQMYHWQLYGYYEIKCKFEISKGNHWAVWLLPTDNSWPPEIDIVEVVSPSWNTAFVNAHGAPGKMKNPEISPDGPVGGVDVSQYHTYAFEWRADSLKWIIDGRVVKKMANYIDKDMYLLISPEIGGNWPGMPDASTQWPTVCEIDYIRIYECTGQSAAEAENGQIHQPDGFGLKANFPNPFNPNTMLTCALAESGPVCLDIYDVRGTLVKSLVNQRLPAGTHQFHWDGRNDRGGMLAGGCYFARLTYTEHAQVKKACQKLLLLK